MSAEIGVRELRQNLSGALRRVKEGERLIVTERNRPVAQLTPLPEAQGPIERLVAQGKVRPPADPGPLPMSPLPPDAADPFSLSRALEEVRGERP